MRISKEILIELVNRGLSNKKISEELNVSRSTIVREKSKYNLNSKYYEIKSEIKKCEFCNEEFKSIKSDNRKFCSRECSINSQKKSNELKICEFCNEEFIISGRNISKNRKFCSTDCHKKYVEDSRFKKLEYNGGVSNKTARLYLIKKFGEKCMNCGWDKKNTVSGKCPIELEHIDGNSENNNLDNLKLLCPNCHSLTPTYKSLNKGKGRHKRRERYKEGRSY
jgi:hypothetical protein